MKSTTALYVAIATVAVFGTTRSARAHYGQRVWLDVAGGKITTLTGPPGDSPATYTPGQFSPGRIFARDLGEGGNVSYTTMLGGPLASDGDEDDDGDHFQTNFPGYEKTPFPSSSFSGTFNLSFYGAPLYYVPGANNTPAHFLKVASAFAGKMNAAGQPLVTPSFTYDAVVAGPGGNTGVTITSPATDAATNASQTIPAFTAGSHGHPLFTLHPNPFDSGYNGSATDDVADSDEYDGIYAVGLRLSQGSLMSDPFYLIVGKNVSLADIADAATSRSAATLTALPGDADLDLDVSINDFNALASNFGKSSGMTWADGDFDFDGGVSINDFNLLAGNFGKSVAPVGLRAVVPEPALLGLLPAFAVVARRRRRRS